MPEGPMSKGQLECEIHKLEARDAPLEERMEAPAAQDSIENKFDIVQKGRMSPMLIKTMAYNMGTVTDLLLAVGNTETLARARLAEFLENGSNPQVYLILSIRNNQIIASSGDVGGTRPLPPSAYSSLYAIFARPKDKSTEAK